MCGRVTTTYRWEVITASPGLLTSGPDLRDTPRFNVAPTARLHAIRTLRSEPPRAEPLHWGFPTGKAGAGGDIINARHETAHEKPTFAGALRHRRRLVPVSGCDEWQRRAY